MAGKFNLLTIMTLNAAGYKAGIDDAKKTTQGLVTGTNQAVNAIGSQFSRLGGMGAGVIAPLSGIKGAVMSGIGSFKAMIPAMNGVKMAMVGTGIGAIVVALGLAFGALTSYLSGTSEGSKKLREMLGFVSGAVTALMNRVKHLGGALFSLLTGDIAGFKKGVAEAFASGFFEEVVSSAKESNDIEKQKSANIKIQRDLQTQISGLVKESAVLNSKARDPKLDAETRLKYLGQMLDVEDKIEATKLKAAKADLKYKQDIVAMKGFSANGEDKDAVAAALVAVDTIETERINAGTRTARLESKLLNSIAKEEDDIQKKRVKDALELINLKYKVGGKDIGVNKIKTAAPVELDMKGIDKSMGNTYRKVSKQTNDLEKQGTAWDVLGMKIKDTQYLTETFGTAINGITDAFTGMFEGATGAFKGVVTSMLQGIQSIINGLLAQAIAAMIATQATKGLLGLATAAIGVSLLLGLWKSKVPAFANGGIVSGSAFSGDNINARVNSGEMILNRSQQANLFNMANGAGGSGSINPEIRLRLVNGDLVGALAYNNKKMNNIR